MPNYGDPIYWEQRYRRQAGRTFDWLEDFASLQPIINNIVPKTSKIMQLGCGNAMMSSDMYDAGWHFIDNIDISEVCIEQMKESNLERRLMKWKVADALSMPEYKDESYDVVIEKSTLDAILCGDKSFLNAAKMLKEVQRILKTGGLYIIISYGSPENRLFHLVTIIFLGNY